MTEIGLAIIAFIWGQLSTQLFCDIVTDNGEILLI